MEFSTGDIVRFKDNSLGLGLHEITGVYEDRPLQYSVTNDECYTEDYAGQDELILVCRRDVRLDI